MIDKDKIAELRRLEAEQIQEKVARHLCKLMDDEWRLGRKLYMDTAKEILDDIALPELLKALEEAKALLRRVPSALNGAFMAGTEEREGGSARRQDKYAKEGDELRRAIPEFLRTLPTHGGVDV